MEEAALCILRVFDDGGLVRIPAADLLVAAGSGAAAEAALAELTASGALREIAGRYERTEFGRLEAAGPLDLTLLSRPRCHLCEEALRQIEPLAAGFGARLRIVDVDCDQTLRERFGNDIPVLFLGSEELADHRIDAASPRAALAQASKERQRA